jgi:hypothetical protein
MLSDSLRARDESEAVDLEGDPGADRGEAGESALRRAGAGGDHASGAV